jgi:hypothetical protein
MNYQPKIQSLISIARDRFHQNLISGPLVLIKGIPSIADKDNRKSIRLASAMLEKIGIPRSTNEKQAGQTSGGEFEAIVGKFIAETFLNLSHLRPGRWSVISNPGRIGQFEQYQHLDVLLDLVKNHPETRASLGGDYLIRPDLVVVREPEPDTAINTAATTVVSDGLPAYSPLRKSNNDLFLLHASISCKWTIRSDRSQNTRTEALNLMRNRKGSVPKAVAVTAEPLPSRIGSIAYGTGDLDCIYHIALPELLAACTAEGDDEELRVLIEGRRLRDIADLPLDLAT